MKNETSCESFEIAISSMLDGELNGAEKVALGEHLVQCRSCRELARGFESINQSVYTLAAPPESVSTKLSAPQRNRWTWTRILPAGVAAAIAVCIIVVAWPGKPAAATQFSPEQMVQPIKEIHALHKQQLRDQDLLLQTLEISMIMLRLELESLDPNDANYAPMSQKIDAMLQRIRAQQLESAMDDL